MSSLWIAWPCLALVATAYYYVFGAGFSLSLVTLTFLLYFAIVAGIVRLLSKDFTLWFDEQYMYIQVNQNEVKKYQKQEIIGFYNYDYTVKSSILSNSKIAIHFFLSDGKKLYLNDSAYRNTVEVDKQELLLKFLKTAQIELGFDQLHRKYAYYPNNVYWYACTCENNQ